MVRIWRLAAIGVGALTAVACAGTDSGDTTTSATPVPTVIVTNTTVVPPTTHLAQTTTTNEPVSEEPEVRSLDAPAAVITVDGDPSDWDSVDGLTLTLEPITAEADKGIENKEATIKMAHDDVNVYALFTVVDDYNWDVDDPHLSGAPSLSFPVDTGGPHMGADDEEGENSTGMVDIWHWELECGAGEASGGGAGHSAGEGANPGNDSMCNYDDEWATDAETREDDNSATGENSLLGVWTHSNPTTDAPGIWYFEMSRPLQTGDGQDGQFVVGESALLALAYWDPDYGPDGWDDSTHVQSSNQGWIEVTFR